MAEFLGDATIEHVLQPRDDFGDVLDPARYLRQEEAVAAWFDVFFPDAARSGRRVGHAHGASRWASGSSATCSSSTCSSS